MNTLDYAVLFGSILAIALYGILRTRGRRTLHDYLKGKKRGGGSWFAIGLSVMATQASAVTFLSTPGQGYADGMAFVQNYFAVPLAMIIIAAVFLPMFRRLNVYTAYEYLGTRFDKKTRLFAAAIFLIQRGMGAGITILAPAIVLSTVFGWSLPLTIIASGAVCTIYTVAGGSDAVTHTQKYQFAIIMGTMILAFCILLSKIPCSFGDALTLAGHFGKTNAVDFSLDPKKRYTFWTGMFGGIFLMLSYFGTDQSQVQRYITGDNLRESRLGLMFNALFKIPMQFFILLLGVMLFVFYQFNPQPLSFNHSAFQRHMESTRMLARDPYRPDWDDEFDKHSEGELLSRENQQFDVNQNEKTRLYQEWLSARRADDLGKQATLTNQISGVNSDAETYRMDTRIILRNADPHLSTNDNDYVFITFIIDNLPHGLIGLLIASFFFATLQSKSAELNALASCSIIDFYRYLVRPPKELPEAQPSRPAPTESAGLISNSTDSTLAYQTPIQNQKSKIKNEDLHYVRASRLFTVAWGILAILFALFAHLSENLIQATNIIGSVFYGVVLGLFLIAFFIKFIRGTAAFWGAVLAEILVLGWFTAGQFIPQLNIAYLWYNLIGSLGCIFFAVILQLILGPPRDARGFPITANNPQ